MMEMLWTDPQEETGRGPSKRGVGMQFGPDITKRFCENNGLEAIIRSHEVRMDGYEVQHDGRCITGKLNQHYWPNNPANRPSLLRPPVLRLNREPRCLHQRPLGLQAAV